jgi:hypothetical protein
MMESVNVGDTIRFSVALLKDFYDQPDHVTVVVRVREVRTEADGSKLLVLERYDLQPCECGCGKLVEGGMLERAHPEDFRAERG